MKPLSWVAGALVWVVAGLVATLGVLLSATIILLPVGIPLLVLAGRLFARSVRLVLPRAVVHPVRELQRQTVARGSRAAQRGRNAFAVLRASAAPTRRRPRLRKRIRRRVRRARRCLQAA